MKKDAMFDGVTHIRDDIVENTARKKRRRRLLIPAAAAVLAVCIVLVCLTIWRGGRSFAGSGTVPGGLRPLARVSYTQSREPVSLEEDEREALYKFVSRAAPELLLAQSGNALISPVNVYMSLSMLAEAAGGGTREQILELLGAESVTELRSGANHLWKMLYNDDGTYTLGLSNSLWLRDDCPYDRGTVDTLADSYYAWVYRGEMGGDKMNRTLQNWLNVNTLGLLGEAARKVTLPEYTAMAIAGTVAFSDKWHRKFLPENTAPGTFHSPGGDRDADFMHSSFESYYYWGDNFTAVSRSFELGGSMWFLLPDEGVSAEELMGDERAMKLLLCGEYRDAESEYIKINLSLPKFDIVSDTDLAEALAALGVVDAFDPLTADFSALIPPGTGNDPVWISGVNHASRVTVDEEGVKAAAYTVVSAPGAAPPPDKEADLTFDRPFLFSLMKDGVPVFAGVVNEP